MQPIVSQGGLKVLFVHSWTKLDQLGRQQWGLVTSSQAREVLSRTTVARYRAEGRLLVVRPGVYRLAGVPASWRQRMLAACLAYGEPVALSHRAAAKLWGLEGILANDCEVTVPPGRSGRVPGIVTHRAPLPEGDVTRREQIPVTTVARTLLDLRRCLALPVIEKAVDQAQRLHLLTPEELERRQASRVGRGYRGAGVFRKMLDLRLEHPGIGDSPLEEQTFRWIVGAGLGVPERQVQVSVNGRTYVLDIAFEDRKIGLECDGFDYHGRRWRFDADAVRHSDLALAGWMVRRVTATQSREEVLAWVHEALRLRPSETGR